MVTLSLLFLVLLLVLLFFLLFFLYYPPGILKSSPFLFLSIMFPYHLHIFLSLSCPLPDLPSLLHHLPSLCNPPSTFLVPFLLHLLLC